MPFEEEHCVFRRRSDCAKVCIESDIETVETQTEPDQSNQHEILQDLSFRLQNDHEEFKRFIHSEILELKLRWQTDLTALPEKITLMEAPMEIIYMRP